MNVAAALEPPLAVDEVDAVVALEEEVEEVERTVVIEPLAWVAADVRVALEAAAVEVTATAVAPPCTAKADAFSVSVTVAAPFWTAVHTATPFAIPHASAMVNVSAGTAYAMTASLGPSIRVAGRESVQVVRDRGSSSRGH